MCNVVKILPTTFNRTLQKMGGFQERQLQVKLRY